MDPQIYKYYLWCEQRQTIALIMANKDKDTFAIGYWDQYGQPIGSIFKAVETTTQQTRVITKEDATIVWESLVSRGICKRISNRTAEEKFPDLKKIGPEMFSLGWAWPKLLRGARDRVTASQDQWQWGESESTTPHGEAISAKVDKGQPAFALSRKLLFLLGLCK